MTIVVMTLLKFAIELGRCHILSETADCSIRAGKRTISGFSGLQNAVFFLTEHITLISADQFWGAKCLKGVSAVCYRLRSCSFARVFVRHANELVRCGIRFCCTDMKQNR